MSEPKVNVCLLVHNRLRLTQQAVESLSATTPADAYTLAVLDDDSSDFRIGRYLSSLHHAATLRVLNSTHVLSQLKNTLVAWSEQVYGRADYLLLIDNDVCFLPGWLDTMLEAYKAGQLEQVALLGGQRHPFHQAKYDLTKLWIETDAVAGTSWFLSWSRWRPFDRSSAPGVCQSEDFAWCQQAKQEGLRVGYTAEDCILDCGITQTDGKAAPGAELKRRMQGVLYE